jgi:hypothetical protein
VEGFQDLHLFSPRIVGNLCFESVKVGCLCCVSPSRELIVITLYAENVRTFLGYQIQNRPRNKKTTGFLLAPSLVFGRGWS